MYESIDRVVGLVSLKELAKKATDYIRIYPQDGLLYTVERENKKIEDIPDITILVSNYYYAKIPITFVAHGVDKNSVQALHIHHGGAYTLKTLLQTKPTNLNVTYYSSNLSEKMKDLGVDQELIVVEGRRISEQTNRTLSVNTVYLYGHPKEVKSSYSSIIGTSTAYREELPVEVREE
jgi:hypothetical protein